jgi:osmotically-inducible protein OsmY
MSSLAADQTITNQVMMKLAKRGFRAPCNVRVQTKRGEVTLTGTVQFPHQKGAAVQAATGVTGVRRVTDQTTIAAKRVF